MTRSRRRAALAGALALALLTACARPEKPGRVIVFGLDGADPATIDLLLSEGRLPHFAKLRQSGAYAPLLSQKPLLSPVIWTTIATGKTPDAHRIGHFVAVGASGEQLPVTSSMRRVKALWNILTDRGRSSAVVGWWATWPAEKIRGTVVSDHFAYHFLMEDAAGKDPNDAGRVFPPDAAKTLEADAKPPQDVTREELAPFVDVPAEEFQRPFDFTNDLAHFKWAYATAGTYTRIALRLWRQDRPDDLFVYIEGLDSTSHLFGHLFRATNLSGELAEQQRRYGHAVEAMYAYADTLLGTVMDAMDARTTLLVVSDHGFELGRLQEDPSKTRDMRRVSELFHRPEGILYLYGYRVKSRTRLNRPTILDVAPTVLALNGLGRAADMPGRILTEGLDLTAPPTVGTYETSAAAAAVSPAADAVADPQIVKKLQSLGYIGAHSPTGDRNLAGIHFEQGRYEEAVREYAVLVEQNPKDSGLRASYAGALGALGRYDAALEQLDAAIALEPVNVEAYHNRAVIHERRGERDAAVRDYQTAVRYNPQYEPSRQALSRLKAPLPQAPRGDAETKAAALCEEAASAARRGDYAASAQRLDEAARAAPRFALVYQYRANVAYLRGDRAAAIAALRAGLKIEPGNALFRENLKRLEQPAAR